MMDWYSYLLSLALLFAGAVLAWLWSLMILAVPVVTLALQPQPTWRGMLVTALALIWALRLSGYITWRNWGEPEDYRYRAIRRNNQPYFHIKSLYIVFGLQAFLAWVVALPLHAALLAPAPPGWLDGLGLLLWLAGFLFEAVGDAQLAAFKQDPANDGAVMDRGLWRYTRHPNYFGECCLWWGFFCFALAGGGWWSVISPLLMTVLLLKVSGVAMLEKDIGTRRPAYRDYVARTNAFVPGPPARSA
jgi:steroid 5-alpha reductase family enzyme